MTNIAEKIFDKVLSEIGNKNKTSIDDNLIIKINQEDKCILETYKQIKTENKVIDNITGDINIFPQSYLITHNPQPI